MTIDRYLVLGNPVMHSKSPLIHAAFAKQTGETLDYGQLLVAQDAFDSVIRQLQADGVCGVNVTIPFKENAFHIADESSLRAEKAMAANTLVFRDDGSVLADNTDGVGLVTDLVANNRQAISGKRVLILGAGGAVRGILMSLIAKQPAAVTIANRTQARAKKLQTLAADDFSIQVCGFADLTGKVFDLIISGTSPDFWEATIPLPDDILAQGATAYDVVYGDRSLPFQAWARAQGAIAAIDGLGMLVEQAAESFLVWRGVRPETSEVIQMLRNNE